MNSTCVTGRDGRPAPISDTIAVMTAGVDAVLRRVPDLARALTSIGSGGQAAREVPGWRATYPMDDPANEPDLWIREAAPILWIKRDDHEPWQTDAAGKCDWCGRRHAGVMTILTVLLPDEY